MTEGEPVGWGGCEKRWDAGNKAKNTWNNRVPRPCSDRNYVTHLSVTVRRLRGGDKEAGKTQACLSRVFLEKTH